jgi:hypothetical protein
MRKYRMRKLLLAISTLVAIAMVFIAAARAGDIAAKKITGTAATVQLSTTSTPVQWIQLVTPTGNAANVLWGDCTVTSSANGSILPAGSGQMLPPKQQGGYDLAQVCVYVANMDVVYVSWEKYQTGN